MDRQEQMLNELREISEQYAKEITGKRRPWPRSIRDRVIALRQDRVSFERISKATGLPIQTMYSWRIGGKRASAFFPVRVAPKPANLQPSLLESRRRRRSSDSIPTVTVVIKGNLRIEGLSLEQAIVAARRLS